MVTALKVSSTPLFSSDCSAPAAIGASVNTKASMVAMSGAIMPAPLAMPLIVTLALPSFTVAVATFGKVSVVMIALAASIQSPGAACSARRAEHAVEFGGVERFADHAGGGEKHLAGAAAERLGGDRGRQRRRLPAGLAGEGIGVAGIHHQRAGACLEEPRPSLARHHSTGADGHFDWVKTPATVGPLVHDREQHVGAALVADAGRRGRKLHARNRGHVGDVGRGERGDGGWTWATPATRQEAIDRHGRD